MEEREGTGVEAAPIVDVSYSLTVRDLLEPLITGSRHSMLAAFMAILAVWMGALGLVMGDAFDVMVAVLMALFAVGIVPAAISLFFATRRRDLLAEERHLVIDAEGVRLESARSSSRSTWSVFRRVRETGTALLLDFGTGGVLPLPKRLLGVGGADAVRGIAADNGKLDLQSSWKWPLIGLVLGVVLTSAFLAVTL